MLSAWTRKPSDMRVTPTRSGRWKPFPPLRTMRPYAEAARTSLGCRLDSLRSHAQGAAHKGIVQTVQWVGSPLRSRRIMPLPLSIMRRQPMECRLASCVMGAGQKRSKVGQAPRPNSPDCTDDSSIRSSLKLHRTSRLIRFYHFCRDCEQSVLFSIYKVSLRSFIYPVFGGAVHCGCLFAAAPYRKGKCTPSSPLRRVTGRRGVTVPQKQGGGGLGSQNKGGTNAV